MGSSSWPQPSTDPNLDRAVSDVQYEQLAAMYSGNGLVGDPSMQSMVYADATGRTVKLRPNRMGLVHGHPFRTDASGVTLTVSTASAARTDLVVLRLDRTTWTVTAQIREGVPGGSAPAPQQDADTAGAGSGLWELPIATVATPAGSGGIPATAVTDTAWYLAPQAYVGRSTARPPVAPGLQFTETDTARRLAVLGSSYAVIGENGPSTKLNAPNAGWDGSKFNVFAQRRNGWTYLQGLAYKASGTLDVASGVDVPVVTLPAEFRPPQDFYTAGVMSGDLEVRLFVSAATGVVTIIDHPVFKAGQFVHFGPETYPSV